MAGHSTNKQTNKEHFKEVKEGSDKEDEVGLSSGYMDNQERMKIQKEYEESVLKWKEWSTVLNAAEKDRNLTRVCDAETIVWLTSTSDRRFTPDLTGLALEKEEFYFK